MLGLLSLAIANAYAIGNIWSLDSLRTRAVVNNKSLLMRAGPGDRPLHPQISHYKLSAKGFCQWHIYVHQS